ncbi:YbhB/YbcL family Raf kinase inhibitor-like protein [Parasutterella muris]|jgi:Raf kinase inhibitor-like protein, YbhB/YbcL family|uniref:YbhB/YbcL family Raf kinase inhibitor-like protein n=1 Tax=Parasutterella muris TaxID=2565572 RepID=A0A6L6YFI7_9BURK|nr:YbhB/YbcL family Raf kinase inhibitor-like protein [Parasutterella muris]MVX56134.1 YbhB/YbcL family Raf kinase inhibitor-like protein [Parasutterella muris]
MESIFRVWSDSFDEGAMIPEGYAYAKLDPMGREHTVPAGNRNPQIAWSNPPAGTQSLVVICQDHDVPQDFSMANREDAVIAEDAPRRDFFHWILVDIVPEEPCIDVGTLSKGVTPKGKKGPACANGMRQGLNDYTNFEKPEETGKHYGYDGPCPPWNDERMHRYVFTVYAVDFPLLPLSGSFTGPEVLEAMQGHILASASVSGLYTLNPKLVRK